MSNGILAAIYVGAALGVFMGIAFIYMMMDRRPFRRAALFIVDLIKDRVHPQPDFKKPEKHQLIEQLCNDLNRAHDEIIKLQSQSDPAGFDWPEWTPQANSIRWAEKLLGKRLAKTDSWTMFPEQERP